MVAAAEPQHAGVLASVPPPPPPPPSLSVNTLPTPSSSLPPAPPCSACSWEDYITKQKAEAEKERVAMEKQDREMLEYKEGLEADRAARMGGGAKDAGVSKKVRRRRRALGPAAAGMWRRRRRCCVCVRCS